jgi:hypothetical protein
MKKLKIRFDPMGESQVFQVGEDRIFFRLSAEENKIFVLRESGVPYSRTSDYIDFKSIASAENFLVEAIKNQ